MRVSRLYTNILVLFLSLFAITISARAQTDELEDYDVKARVVRISLIAGEVNLKRKGNTEWETARLNFPLVEGDTIATDKESRVEIQVDARNFVRLAASSSLRIITLRDEGVAFGVVDGTATFRLAKFDRTTGYFEIDAPRSTLAAGKTGFYRVDVTREGRVRLTVRDGGSAGIYSDTSGFILRDGRTAELIVDGDNAGDWDLMAAAPKDATDQWFDDRERYLAQRLRYNVQYYDEYIWGAEDLDAYGDWEYTTDYGWIWRPHANSIASYANWAPYRYGHWTYMDPYGWTWVGYEPWGWAPYHYGRWVYHNGLWAWCPRSEHQAPRSFWRPALVAFVQLDFNFGNDICWYPLDYHDRDPRSRNYHDDDRRYPPGHGHGRGPGRGDDPRWRCITRTPRGDFGNRDGRNRGVDERTGRRVLGENPHRGDWPRREGFAGNGNGRSNRDRDPNRPWRRDPNGQPIDRPTGAALRRPGVALDDELRRSRVFRGREPITFGPTRPDAPGEVDTRPTGAGSRPGRGERETGGGGGDGRDQRPGRGRPNSGDAPITVPQPQPGNDQPPVARDPEPRERPSKQPGRIGLPSVSTPTSEQPQPVSPATPVAKEPEAREKPSKQPGRIELPRVSPASPPRDQPSTSGGSNETKVEQPATPSTPPAEAPRRTETPRNEEPRERREMQSRPSRTENYEPPERPSRSESPRSEAPRSSPRSEAPRSEAPRSEAPRSEAPRSEAPRSEAPRSSPRSESPRSESPRSESPRSSPRSESPRSEAPRSEAPRSEAPRSEAPRSESPRSESPRSESPRSESPRSESPRSESPRSESPRSESGRPGRP